MRRLDLSYTNQQVLLNFCTKFRSSRSGSSWEIFDEKKFTNTQTLLRKGKKKKTKKTKKKQKTIYFVYLEYISNGQTYGLTHAMLNKLRCHTHF